MHFSSGLKSAPFRPFCFHENSRFWFKWKPLISLPASAQMCLWSLAPALLHVPTALSGPLPLQFCIRYLHSSPQFPHPSKNGAPDATLGAHTSLCSTGVSKPSLSHAKQSNVNPSKSNFNYSYFTPTFFNLRFFFSPFPMLSLHFNSLLHIVLISLSWHLCTFILTSNWGVNKAGLE